MSHCQRRVIPRASLCLTSRKSSLLRPSSPGILYRGWAGPVYRASLPSRPARGTSRPARLQGLPRTHRQLLLTPRSSCRSPRASTALDMQGSYHEKKRASIRPLPPRLLKSAQYGHAMNKKTSKNQFRNIVQPPPLRPGLPPFTRLHSPLEWFLLSASAGRPARGRSLIRSCGRKAIQREAGENQPGQQRAQDGHADKGISAT